MNKKKIFIILFLILIFATIILTIFKNNTKDEEKWYVNNPLIGHALYGIDNNYYTNSYEALEFGYNKGIKVFEADFLLTSDDKLILNHFWENDEVLTYEKYMSQQIYGQYTPMDIQNLLLYMQEHEDIYIIVDTKQEDYDSTKALGIYSKIVEEANKIDSKLLDRFIVQIYNYEDLKTIKRIYDFNDYIFSVYKLQQLSVLDLIIFCKFNNIDTIAFPKEYINYIGSLDIKLINFLKLKFYVFTVNDEETYQKFLSSGIDGIFTDFIY